MHATQRYSKKREAILQALMNTQEHPSAEWVYLQMRERYPDISLGTVYRNLAQFKEQGKIISLGAVNGVERFDANVKPHVHFICKWCDRVLDLQELDVPQSLCLSAARETGAKVDQCWMTFYGQCGECQPALEKTH